MDPQPVKPSELLGKGSEGEPDTTSASDWQPTTAVADWVHAVQERLAK